MYPGGHEPPEGPPTIECRILSFETAQTIPALTAGGTTEVAPV